MTIKEVKDYINSSPEYDFLRDYPHKIAFLTLGGSYAYGTNTEDSDIDLRGVFLSDKREILLNDNTKLVETKKDTDTVMYTLKKYVDLCAKGNPTALELLYFAPDRYLYVSDIGMELIKNRDMFLSKRVYHAYYGCICSTLSNARTKCYKNMDSDQEKQKKIKRVKKSMMHTVRLLLQGFQLLKSGTMYGTIYDNKQFVDIKNGCKTLSRLYNSGEYVEYTEYYPNEYYYDAVKAMLGRLYYDYEHTTLPDEPDWDRINDFLMTTNERSVRGMV